LLFSAQSGRRQFRASEKYLPNRKESIAVPSIVTFNATLSGFS
jgi:hypothetical protein